MSSALTSENFLEAVSLSTIATYYYPSSGTFDALATSLAGLAMRIIPASALLLLCEAKSALELAAYLRAERGRVINHLNSPEASGMTMPTKVSNVLFIRCTRGSSRSRTATFSPRPTLSCGALYCNA